MTAQFETDRRVTSYEGAMIPRDRCDLFRIVDRPALKLPGGRFRHRYMAHRKEVWTA